jgi:hypothetical protein
MHHKGPASGQVSERQPKCLLLGESAVPSWKYYLSVNRVFPAAMASNILITYNIVQDHRRSLLPANSSLGLGPGLGPK